MSYILGQLLAGNVCGLPCRVREASSGCECTMAADEIARLTARAEQAERERDRTFDGYERAMKDVEKLRAALTEILALWRKGLTAQIGDIARRACEQSLRQED